MEKKYLPKVMFVPCTQKLSLMSLVVVLSAGCGWRKLRMEKEGHEHDNHEITEPMGWWAKFKMSMGMTMGMEHGV